MLRLGVTNPGVFGVGVSLSFVFFAGLWFIGTVVLLLLSVATRPGPRVPWPRTTKLVAALLVIGAFVWPLASTAGSLSRAVHATKSDGTPGSGGVSGSGSTAAGKNQSKAGDLWHVKEDTSPMDGSKRVVLSHDAENDVQGSLDATRPTLVIRCQEGKTDAYIVTGTAANVEFGTENHTVRLRFDASKPMTQGWSESTDQKAG
ncbi:MAG TPA: hypothetical protein VMT20_27735 [Terriglobia bacterium]|nr:hypothetical protein [Terriglobia bacterium]